jgi:pimeloyl-ACP methyl ester carboxylesterase
MAEAAHGPASARGVRLIAPDRPGYGLSSGRVARQIGDWPQDMAELADALAIPRFGVVGVSGGGPYALACAVRMPERLSVVASVSGIAPIADAGSLSGLDRQHRAVLAVARRAPWVGSALMAAAGLAWRRDPDGMYRRLQAWAPRADHAVLARPEVASSMIAGVREAFRQGSRGAADELRLFIQPWGFALEEIALPVHVWHGARDTLVPRVAAQRLADSIRDCRLEMVADGGHYLVYEIMDDLLAILRREVEAGERGAARRGSGAAPGLPAGSLTGG